MRKRFRDWVNKQSSPVQPSALVIAPSLLRCRTWVVGVRTPPCGSDRVRSTGSCQFKKNSPPLLPTTAKRDLRPGGGGSVLGVLTSYWETGHCSMPGIEGKLLLLSTSYVILAILSTRRTPTVISAPQTRVTGLAPRRIKNRHDR